MNYLQTLIPRAAIVSTLGILSVVASSGLAFQANLVYRDQVKATWYEPLEMMSYRVDASADGFEYYQVDLAAAAGETKKQPVFDPSKLSQALSQHLGESVAPEDLLSIRSLTLLDRAGAFEFRFGSQQFNCDANYNVTKAQRETAAALESFTTAGRSFSGGEDTSLRVTNRLDHPIVCVWLSTSGSGIEYERIDPAGTAEQHTFENHIWSLRDEGGQELIRFLAQAGGTDIQLNAELVSAYAAYQSAESDNRKKETAAASNDPSLPRVRIRNGNVWLDKEDGNSKSQLSDDASREVTYRGPVVMSSDGKFAICRRIQVAEKRQVHLVEASPPDQLQPKLHSFDYVKPGDAIDQPQIALWDLETETQFVVADELLANPWALSNLQWSQASQEFLFLYNQRGHQRMRVIALNPQDQTLRVVVEESSPTFIDYSQKTYCQPLGDGGELLWMSERSGTNHLVRFDVASGKLMNAVTQGDWVVRKVERIDEAAGHVYLTASGLHPEQDPYYQHLCRVDFSGENLVVLTEGDGEHGWDFSPDGKWLIDRYSRVDMPPVTNLRNAATGKLVAELERADWQALLASGWSVPERFVSKGRDGKTDIFGIIVRPSKLTEGAKYPLVEKIYAGPHSSHVPKSFGMLRQEHEFAEMGFIVVRIDGMGTSNRGKAFHDVCWKNLADAGFPDRKLWIRAAAENYPQIDLSRVGIFGGSAGGQNAMRALIDHHDLYHVAVADCGCHDNRMDKIWWNEAWMGWPVDEAYVESSNVEHAHRVQGELLLIVGEMDRNVDPASTMQVAAALVEAGKEFELLVMPSTGHGAAETAYGSDRRGEFLRRHLLLDAD